MTITFALSAPASDTCAAVAEYAQQAAARQAWPVGVCEMAAGAAVLTAGLASRTLQLGVDLVLHPLYVAPRPPAPEEAACAVLGMLPTRLLEKTGIAGAGPALVVPALALVAGGAVLLGLGDCTPAASVRQFLAGVPQGGSALPSGALLAAGVALLVQGAQRLSTGGAERGGRAWRDADRLTLHRLSSRHAITTWAAFATYADTLGTLAAPWLETSATLAAPLATPLATPHPEERFIRQALLRRPAPPPVLRGFDLPPRQAGAEAD